MVSPVEFQLHIDAYKPDTMPMERLAQYLLDWAILLGETQSVHLDRVDGGSVVPVAKVEWEAAPKVRKRLADARANEGPDEAKEAKRRIDKRLIDDNASATLYEKQPQGEPRKLLYFPGAKATANVDYGPFKQPGTLTGIPIVIGGENDPVSVHIEDRDEVHVCRASRDIAKEIAPFLFTAPIRVSGVGTWYRSRDGEWSMRRFVIESFTKLRHETVAEAAERLQGLRTRLQTMDDPVAALRDLQADKAKKRSKR